MSSEIVAVEQSTAPSTIQPLQTVDVEAAKDFMDNYQELVEALLDKSDYQAIRTAEGIKQSKKKSAWRKLQTAFNISDDVVEKEIIRDECHRIISARYEVMATLPNGRHCVGTGSCSIFDKVSKKDTKEPTPFELRQRFTNAEHDVISTAHTRAKSRAISDLIGAGEVSAEELSGMDVKPNKPVKPKTPKPKVPNTSTMGAKPKAPKTKSPKPNIEDGAIEVEAKEVQDLSGDTPSKPLKELIDENPTIRLAVNELQANEETVNRERIQDKLLDLMELGKINTGEYKTAKSLLE